MKTSIRRAARNARESTRWRASCSRCSNSVVVAASSTAPANAVSLSGGSVGRSSIIPNMNPGRTQSNPRSRASSGRSAIWGAACRTPAASSNGATTSGPPGCAELIWSWITSRANVARSSGGSASVGSFSMERNTYWRPSFPTKRSDFVWRRPPQLVGVRPPPKRDKSSTSTSTGAAIRKKIDPQDPAGAAREGGAAEPHARVVMPKNARAAQELVVGARPADHLQRVVVPRGVDERRGAGEPAVQVGPHPPVRPTGHVLARDSACPGDRIDGANQGQGEPEPRLHVPQGKEVVLPAEMPTVWTATRQRMVGDDDYPALAGCSQCRAQGVDHLVLRVRGAGGVGMPRFRPVLQPPLRVQRDDSHRLSHVQHGGPGTAPAGPEHGAAATPPQEPFLPPPRVPASGPLPGPVVVPGHEHAPRAAPSQHGRLGA